MITTWIKKRYRQAADAVKEHKFFYLFALLSMVAAGLFVGIVHNNMFPFAEGWYTYYAKCINEGLLPYRDFEYLYSPIYIYTVALITKIFGYDLIVLRRLGIVIFALIALGIYLSVSIITGKKRSWIALVAAVTAVFYLQTEIVQTFYDYVRLMDAFAAFSLYFLLRTVKGIMENADYRRHLITFSVLGTLFINVKQNIGLIFYVFAVILIVYVSIWCRQSGRQILKNLLWLFIPFAIVMAVVMLPLLISGSLSGYLSMTGLSAAGAKGGMHAILFGWITNNMYAFKNAIPFSIFALVLIVGLYLVHRFLTKNTDVEEKTVAKIGIQHWVGLGFFLLMAVGLTVLALSKHFALWLLPDEYLSPYAVFLIVLPLFAACGVWGIVDMVRHRNTMQDVMLLFSLAGAYFAIAFGCANSGGIAEGQSSFGVAFLVTAVLLFSENILSAFKPLALRVTRYAASGALVMMCLVLSLQYADKKMVYTYNWWGMDESDYWSSTEELNLPLTEGIKVSPETKAVYENICNAIMQNTAPDDPIFCFPQIPIFYNICDRKDPGTFTKVQWFDVASDASVRNDIEVLKNNPPKAIVIYNTSDGAYQAHEDAFRGGNASATREMREFLYNYVADNGYRFYGRYVANNNSLSLWIADTDDETTPAVNFERGTGTAEDPFIIANSDQFLMFAQMVNAGRTFHGQYIRQEADVNLHGMDLPTIGEAGKHSYFSGVYDGGGHVIRNANIVGDAEILGLFGTLAGELYNLGIENITVASTGCSGGLVGSAANSNAKIINCFADVYVSGYRAGGIADDFNGTIENCISLGTLLGEEIANAVSRDVAQSMKNVFVAKESILTAPMDGVTTDERITAVSRETLNSAALADILNAHVDRVNTEQSGQDNGIPLLRWQVGPNGHLVFQTQN